MELNKREQFTKEQLQQIVENDHVQCGNAAAMARQLLASMEQEPVAWTDADELRDAKECTSGYLFAIDGKANKFADPRRMIMLYAAPQLPQPAVPDECPHELVDFCERVIDSRIAANAKAEELWEACHAAMLKGGAE